MLRIQASRCRMNAKRFAQHHLALAAYISWDMALLPIWITSGSCFALIHSGTNDVPPSPSRSCPSAIPSTISPRLACIYPGFISSRFCSNTRTDGKFLNIGWKRFTATSCESWRALFLNRLYFRSLLLPRRSFFILTQDLRWYTVGCFWRKRRYWDWQVVVSRQYFGKFI